MMRRRELIDTEHCLTSLGQLINGRASHRTQTKYDRVKLTFHGCIHFIKSYGLCGNCVRIALCADGQYKGRMPRRNHRLLDWTWNRHVVKSSRRYNAVD